MCTLVCLWILWLQEIMNYYGSKTLIYLIIFIFYTFSDMSLSPDELLINLNVWN